MIKIGQFFSKSIRTIHQSRSANRLHLLFNQNINRSFLDDITKSRRFFCSKYDPSNAASKKIESLLQQTTASQEMFDLVSKSYLDLEKDSSMESKRKLLSINKLYKSELKNLKSRLSLKEKCDCFICFNADETNVINWLKIFLAKDLEQIGIQPIFSPWNLNIGVSINQFQKKIRHSDFVIIACSPGMKEKCSQRSASPTGVAMEIALTENRNNDREKEGTTFPIFLNYIRKRDFPTEYFENIYGPEFSTDNRKGVSSRFEYYYKAFEIFFSFSKLPDSRKTAAEIQEKFLLKSKNILIKGHTHTEEINKESPLKITDHCLRKLIGINDCIDRKQELDQIDHLFSQSNLVAITGISGIGKTTIALKYSAENRKKYKHIFLIKGERILGDTLELANFFGIPLMQTEHRLAVTKNTIANIGESCLLIIDGVDRTKLFVEIEKLFPLNQVRILLTTINPITAKLHQYQTINIDSLSNKESIKYLITETKSNDEKAASQLANSLGNHLLALSYAARYIMSTNIKLDDYESLFKDSSNIIAETPLLPEEKEKTILKVWKITIDHIVRAHSNPFAKDLFAIFSTLSDLPVPLPFLYELSNHPYLTMPKILKSISLLLDYSLISSPEADKYEAHPLIKKVFLDRESKEESKERMYPMSIGASRYLVSFDMKKLDDRNAIRPLIPHIKCILSHICIHYPSTFDYYKNSLDVFNKIFEYYFYEGNFEDALENCRYQQKVITNMFGEENLYFAECCNRMGIVYSELKNNQEALSYKKRAYKIRKKITGHQSILIADSLANIAISHDELGDHKKALEMKVKALNIRLQKEGEESRAIARVLNSIGETLGNLKRYHDAIGVLNEALEMRKKFLKEDDLLIVSNLNNLGVVYFNLGNFQKSYEKLNMALEVSKKQYRKKHPLILKLLSNITIVLDKMGRAKEANSMRKETQKIARKTFQIANERKTNEKIEPLIERYDWKSAFNENMRYLQTFTTL